MVRFRGALQNKHVLCRSPAACGGRSPLACMQSDCSWDSQTKLESHAFLRDNQQQEALGRPYQARCSS